MMMGMHNKQKQPVKSAQGCGNNAVCVDCPLCYTMVPVNYKCVTAPVFASSQKYFTRQTNLIAGFIAKKWKPPMAG
jgi:hypothetical protein